jgi:hypothetical protein
VMDEWKESPTSDDDRFRASGTSGRASVGARASPACAHLVKEKDNWTCLRYIHWYNLSVSYHNAWYCGFCPHYILTYSSHKSVHTLRTYSPSSFPYPHLYSQTKAFSLPSSLSCIRIKRMSSILNCNILNISAGKGEKD